MKRYILETALATFAAITTCHLAQAQSISFETDDYKAIGVYDTWEQSPFRTGELKGNAAIIANHLTETDEALGVAPNPSGKILGIQRSRFGSNTFGVRIDLSETFELPTSTRYIHVLIHKPTAGRVMLVGLGKRKERAGQSPEAEQFWVLSSTKVEPGKWCDAVFPIKGSPGIDIYSLVVIPDCESPHRLSEDFAAYVDDIVLNDDARTRTQREEYPVNFDPEATYTRTDRFLKAIKLQAQTITVATSVTKQLPVYQQLMDKTFQAKVGQSVTPTFNYQGTWMSGYVYIDYGRDGQFSCDINSDGTPATGSDVVSYSFYENKNSAGKNVANGNVLNPPSFTIPATTEPGFYRMRYKVDWNYIDAGGCPGPENFIINNGGAIADVRINIHGDEVNVNDANRNGEVLAQDGTKLASYKTAWGKPFTIKMNPERGFIHKGIRLRHGYNLGGDSLIHGTAQYADTIIGPEHFNEAGEYTIPATLVDGDLQIEGLFVQDSSQPTLDIDVPEGYELIFHDEFNQEDYSQPNPEVWSSSTRRSSAWNRYIKDDPAVVFIEDGALVCRAQKNEDASDNVPMITGARETKDKFSFTYGIVEVRLKTLRHTGNFPAAWMMPQPPTDKWPVGGEIDIFETIDAQNRAWHTVHTNWTYNMGNKQNSSYNESMNVEEWHVYGLEWSEDEILWTVDGELVGHYERSKDSYALESGQWPFTKPFYIILNQSVGMGTWAANPDVDFTYETRFDYVRVFQKKETGIHEATSKIENGATYDLQGRQVNPQTFKGICVTNGKKLINL